MVNQNNTVKITFLMDNKAGPECVSEHGLSILIEAEKFILFDAGQSNNFKVNSKAIGLDLNGLDTAVLSHGHYDHGNGFVHIPGLKLICHPECFTRRYREKKSSYIGLQFDQDFAKEKFDLVLSSAPYKVSDKVTFLGEIPRLNSFEAKDTSFFKENGDPDFVIDDSGLVVDTSKGLIIIVGCGHAGICNIIEYAKKLSGKDKIVAVIGGFHLKTESSLIEPTIDYLKRQNIGVLIPCHCVDEPVIAQMKKCLNVETIFSGKKLEFLD